MKDNIAKIICVVEEQSVEKQVEFSVELPFLDAEIDLGLTMRNYYTNEKIELI